MEATAFFNLDTKSSTNGGAVEGTHYVLVADGNGIKHRIFNFENFELCRRTGIIELEPVKRKSSHENYLSITKCYDKVNDIIIGIPRGINSKTKELEFERLVLREEEIFDLTKPKDAMRWAVWKHHRDIDLDGTKTRYGMRPKYKVYDKEREAEIFHFDRVKKRKAVDIAEGLSTSQLRDMAINLGFNADSMSIKQKSMKIIQFSEEKPKAFLDIWDNPNRHQLTILKKGLACAVLTQDPILGICYGGLSLGTAEPQAIAYLQDNIQLCNTLEQLISNKEVDGDKSMDANTNPIVDEKDAKVKRLETELAEMKKAFKAVSETKLDDLVEKTTEKLINLDEEHAELLKEAKELKIPGAHLVKDKELLRQKIVDKKAQVEN